MQIIKPVPDVVESLASMLHTVWRVWLDKTLQAGIVNDDLTLTLRTSTVMRMRKLQSVSYVNLTSPEKEAYRELASEIEDALSREYVLLPKEDYNAKVQSTSKANLDAVRLELVDCLVYARAEALGKNQTVVDKCTRVLALLNESNPKTNKKRDYLVRN